jgi:hypothetical protein
VPLQFKYHVVFSHSTTTSVIANQNVMGNCNSWQQIICQQAECKIRDVLQIITMDTLGFQIRNNLDFQAELEEIGNGGARDFLVKMDIIHGHAKVQTVELHTILVLWVQPQHDFNKIMPQDGALFIPEHVVEQQTQVVNTLQQSHGYNTEAKDTKAN